MTRPADGNLYQVGVHGTPFSFYVMADSIESAAKIADEVKEKSTEISAISRLGVCYR
jgi:hypothetical protein